MDRNETKADTRDWRTGTASSCKGEYRMVFLLATAISIMRFADNKVVEEWELVDEAGMMQQLGVAEAPG